MLRNILVSLSRTFLPWDSHHELEAKKRKVFGFVNIKPVEFIELACKPSEINWLEKNTPSFEQLEDLVVEGSLFPLPILEVAITDSYKDTPIEKGKVISASGLEIAMALYRTGADRIKVGLIPNVAGWPSLTISLGDPDMPFAKRSLEEADVPRILRSAYGNYKLPISNKFHLL